MTNWLTFSSSILSATVGITNFLRFGPAKMNKSTRVILFVLFLNLMSLVLKAFAVAWAIMHNGAMTWMGKITWGSFASTLIYLPNLTYATGVLFIEFGPKKGFDLILRYPGLVLTPVFSPITFGSQQCQCNTRCYPKLCCPLPTIRNGLIQMSMKHTTVNTAMTFIFISVVMIITTSWMERIVLYGVISCALLQLCLTIFFLLVYKSIKQSHK